MTEPFSAHRRLPFGAEVEADGRVRFRLWAPSAAAVELCLDGQRPRPMEAADGWFELTVAAAAGSRYRYRIDNGLQVPDPAARYNPDGVHAASEVIDPGAFRWQDHGWRGRPWEDAVCYELHVGTFSPGGDYAGVERRLDHLQELGVTAVELMPLAAFPGRRNWGYDGVLPFAPAACYGHPDDLKRLVQTAHQRGLMVLLDVVYNHFGPDGNYLHVYAEPFFAPERQTPWGAAIDFTRPEVREFFINNALYWLEEYRFDGLRLDAVHAIEDPSEQHFLAELAERVRRGPGGERQVHLVLENDNNEAWLLAREPDVRGPKHYRAQWNDDLHHAWHVLLSGETDGYYGDYADDTLARLGRCLAEGFGYQGEASAHRGGVRRGEPSKSLPATALVGFLQNHDQIGNRAFGERLTELTEQRPLRAAVAALLLAPQIPLLFMGEEWGSRQPFNFFCDFDGELAEAVRAGRRREFARFEAFADPQTLERLPDPQAESTLEAARLDWRHDDQARDWLAYYRRLLALRRERIVPLLGLLAAGQSRFRLSEQTVLQVDWPLTDGRVLTLTGNFGGVARTLPLPEGENDTLFASADPPEAGWQVVWTLTGAAGG